MKPKEAVDGLNYMISGGCTDSHWDFIDEIELAIEALKKKIPKKPYEEYGDMHCKLCGDVVMLDDNYCPSCGQAIDWSECRWIENNA